MTQQASRFWTKSKTTGEWRGCRTPQEIKQRSANCWSKVGHEFFDLLFGSGLKVEEKAVVVCLLEQVYRFGNGKADTRQSVVGTRVQLAESAGLSVNGAWAAVKSLEEKAIVSIGAVANGKYCFAFSKANELTAPEVRRHEERVRNRQLEVLDEMAEEAIALGLEHWASLSLDGAFIELMEYDYGFARGDKERREVLLKYGKADN